jgi:hypothetical protein
MCKQQFHGPGLTLTVANKQLTQKADRLAEANSKLASRNSHLIVSYRQAHEAAVKAAQERAAFAAEMARLTALVNAMQAGGGGR